MPRGSRARGRSRQCYPQWRVRAGRPYLYFKWRHGARFVERYTGPENDQTKTLVERHKRRRDDYSERRDMLRMLVGGRMPHPDTRTGRVIAALADAGVFRLRGVLVGTCALQIYALMIGTAPRGAALRTQDVDIAQAEALINILRIQQPILLEEACADACGGGPSRRRQLKAAAQLLPEDVRAGLKLI